MAWLALFKGPCFQVACSTYAERWWAAQWNSESQDKTIFMWSNQALLFRSITPQLALCTLPRAQCASQLAPAGHVPGSRQHLLFSPQILELCTTCSRKSPSSTIFWIALNYYWSFLGIKLFQRFGKHRALCVAETGGHPVSPALSTPEMLCILGSWNIFISVFSAQVSLFHPIIHVLNTGCSLFVF